MHRYDSAFTMHYRWFDDEKQSVFTYKEYQKSSDNIKLRYPYICSCYGVLYDVFQNDRV